MSTSVMSHTKCELTALSLSLSVCIPWCTHHTRIEKRKTNECPAGTRATSAVHAPSDTRDARRLAELRASLAGDGFISIIPRDLFEHGGGNVLHKSSGARGGMTGVPTRPQGNKVVGTLRSKAFAPFMPSERAYARAVWSVLLPPTEEIHLIGAMCSRGTVLTDSSF